jgi:hypothetical protein
MTYRKWKIRCRRAGALWYAKAFRGYRSIWQLTGRTTLARARASIKMHIDYIHEQGWIK